MLGSHYLTREQLHDTYTAQCALPPASEDRRCAATDVSLQSPVPILLRRLRTYFSTPVEEDTACSPFEAPWDTDRHGTYGPAQLSEHS